MKTLIEVKEEMYNNMKDRYNDFLGDEERYIAENLQSEDGTALYTEAGACDVICQSLDGLCMNDNESTSWEAGYIRGYEVALQELLSNKDDTIHKDQIKYLLSN